MAAAEGRLIRPLLALTREQTAAYCEERGLRWREDESNEDERFARVRVRDALVPALRAVHPAAERNVLTPRGCCARRPSCSTGSSTPSSRARLRSRSRASELPRPRSRA